MFFRRSVLLAGAACLALGGSLVEALAAAARLGEFVIASKVDTVSREPLDSVEVFTPSAERIHATARLSDAPPGTRVRAVFYLAGDPVAEDAMEAAGSRFVSFTLTPPKAGWPEGRYEARYFLNDREQGRKAFRVEAARTVAATKKKPAESSAPGGYRRLHEPNFGLNFEIPASWTANKLKDGGGYLISGPEGKRAGEVALILQFIGKDKAPGSSAKKQYDDALAQYRQLRGFALSKEDKIVVGGVNARYFVGNYPAQDSRGRAVEFRHTQIVLGLPAYYLWLSYAAPVDIYQEQLDHFGHVIETLRFD